ncbi:hypothetical protein HYX18_02420 [Candidatus Woesearchaeota archaeon]|nr:hypothetical protein [Candidatus Woesearchaeota archaeon]
MIKKKVYAIFEILILLFTSLITIDLSSVNVSAQQVISGVQESCCQKTKSGASCIFTNASECDTNALSAPTSCDQTSFCKPGCCFNENSGNCFKNTPRSLCESQANSTWKDDATCNIPQCTRGCCVLSNECSFTTLTRCKRETSLFTDVNSTFLADVPSELECINKCRSLDRGACVKPDGNCAFTTRDGCSQELSTTQSPLVGAVNKTVVGFHKDFLCSHPALGTICARQQKTGCLSDKDEVYWFDSCGNPENIYSSDKRVSFNNGFILSKDKSCSLSGPEDAGCGNCDFAQSTLCKEASREKSPTFGKFTCKSIACSAKDVFKSPSAPASGGPKKAGESWCTFDGQVAFGRDLVGSRHLRKLCIDGQELTEPCADFREEVCVQGLSGESPFDNFQTFFLTGQGKFIEAACRDNRWETCNAANQIKVAGCGADCDKFRDQEQIACCRKKACENLALRDCFWAPFGSSDLNVAPPLGGVCVPHVPPGIRFWEAGLAENTPAGSTSPLAPALTPQAAFNQATTTQTAGLTLCSQATQKCSVKFLKGGIERIFGGSSECIENCHCLDREWIVGANNLCKATGDCGAYFNVEGKPTLEGFSENSDDFALELKDLSDFTTFSKTKDPDEDPKKYELGNVFKRLLLPLGVIGAAGVYTKFFTTAGTFVGASPFAGTALGGIFGTFGGQSFGSAFGYTKWLSKSTINGIKTQNLPGIDIRGRTVFYNDGVRGYVPINDYLKQGYNLEGFSSTSDGVINQVKLVKDKVEFQINDGKLIQPGKPNNILKPSEMPSQTYGFGTFMQIVNTIAWAYTIYSLIDLAFKKEKTQNLVAECRPWVAPIITSPADCEKCNKPGIVCSEYRCKSLGQSCALVNQGTIEEKCVDLHPNDVTAPIITPDENALPPGFNIVEKKGEGFSITPQFKAFQSISLGISTNEPAQCKISLNHSVRFEQMPANFFGSPTFKLNHTMLFALPSEVTSDQLIKLTNGGRFELFVRCADAKNNANQRDYFVKFSIEKGPDLTAPSLEVTSIEDDSFLQFNTTETDLSIFLNEPSECKWDRFDIDFKNMQNNFNCVISSTSRTPLFQGLFECKTKLTGINLGENKFFFRCKDQPGAPEDKRNTNEESFPFTLKVAKQLKATLISPPQNATLFVSNITLKLRTEEGAENGKAKCAFSQQNVPITDMALFLNTDSTEHTQNLILPKGDYTIFIKCLDIAGNLVDLQSKFSIQVDTVPPQLTSIFKQGNILSLTVDEEANCEASTIDFKFGEGIKMLKQGFTHQTTFETSPTFVICKDTSNNEAKFTITE